MTRQSPMRGTGGPIGTDFSQAFARASAAHAAGNLAQAALSCRLILAANKKHFDALHLLGSIELQQGRLEEARGLLKNALKVNPHSAATHLNLALVLLTTDGPAAALPSLDAALKINPNDALALNNRGNALWRLDRHEEALANLDRAVAIAPAYADALTNRGNVLNSLKRYDAALASYDRAVAANPKGAMAWHNRGNVLWLLNRGEEALASYDRSLAVNPDDVDVIIDRGRVALRMRRFEEALIAADRALAIAPDHLPAHNLRGTALWRLKRPEEAVASYSRFLAASPDHPNVLTNLGNALADLGRFDEALASIGRSIEINTENADALWNRSLINLRLGRFEEGWRDYEWRSRKEDSIPHPREFHKPRWHGGDPLVSKTILLHWEQGLGDTIQFARFATPIARRGATVLLEVQPELKDLLARIDGVSEVVGPDDELPPYDCYCPLLSLPLELGIRLDSLPETAPYIAASADRIRKWEGRLPRSGRLRVAIAWAGNPKFLDEHNRSIGLPRLSPLLQVPGVEFYSIQKVLRPGDADILRQHPSVPHLGDEIMDFGDTAAVMSLMDMVISSDTSVVHLAGALGVPVWILLQHAADWRWLVERENSPWYPSARLFRQPRLGDWDSVVEAAITALSQKL